MDRHAADVVAHDLAFAGVQPAADLQAEVLDRRDHRLRAAQPVRRCVERHEEPGPVGHLVCGVAD